MGALATKGMQAAFSPPPSPPLRHAPSAPQPPRRNRGAAPRPWRGHHPRVQLGRLTEGRGGGRGDGALSGGWLGRVGSRREVWSHSRCPALLELGAAGAAFEEGGDDCAPPGIKLEPARARAKGKSERAQYRYNTHCSCTGSRSLRGRQKGWQAWHFFKAITCSRAPCCPRSWGAPPPRPALGGRLPRSLPPGHRNGQPPRSRPGPRSRLVGRQRRASASAVGRRVHRLLGGP